MADDNDAIEYPLPGGRHGLTSNTVIYHRVSCPKCGSFDVSVVTSRPAKRGSAYRVRYHKCKRKRCGHTFKSIERIQKGEHS